MSALSPMSRVRLVTSRRGERLVEPDDGAVGPRYAQAHRFPRCDPAAAGFRLHLLYRRGADVVCPGIASVDAGEIEWIDTATHREHQI